MRKIYLSLVVLMAATLLSTPSFGQHPTCDGVRYTTNISFPTYDSTMAVKFGEAQRANGQNQELFMDIFEPANDNVQERPAIIFAFGGAFILGARSDVHFLCRAYAQQGYVTAAMDYRLLPSFFITDTVQAIDAVVRATSDMKAAVRFLREDAATANNYRIDPNMIIVGGISAGAVTACHAAYLDSNDTVDPVVLNVLNQNGGWEGNSSTNTQYSSEVQGVISYSGALKNVDWMDAGEPPFFAAHDDGDNVVPNGSNQIFFLGQNVFLEGSSSMAAQATTLGIPHQTWIKTGSTGHVSYLNNTNEALQVYLGSTDLMFNDVVCPGTVVSLDAAEAAQSMVYPNPAQDRFALQVPAEWQGYSYQMFDLTGRMVRQANNLQQNEVEILTGELSRGMYLLQVTPNGFPQQVQQHKLILE